MSALAPGSHVGRYIVKRKLAEGGMAEIYLCAAVGPEGFEKEVVIKRVRSFLNSDEAFMKMFVDEARLASRLNHGNIVQIFDFAKHEDTHFIAMEYVQGVSLWDLRRRCREVSMPFPATLAAEIGAQVARGLHYAHTLTDKGRPLGIVHRDVTPHNVLLSFDGAVKLTDFGIAKAGTSSSYTAPGMLKGKFAYMSPEQARGEPVDARTDVFALGIVIWEMLTGGRLFEGDSDLAVLRAVQDSFIAPPARLNPEVPPEMDLVVLKALARKREDRYQTAQEFERALGGFVLKHAASVEDTNVSVFLAAMFRDEIDALRAQEEGRPDGTQSSPGAQPVVESLIGRSATGGGVADTALRATPLPRTAQQPGVARALTGSAARAAVAPTDRALPDIGLRPPTAVMPKLRTDSKKLVMPPGDAVADDSTPKEPHPAHEDAQYPSSATEPYLGDALAQARTSEARGRDAGPSGHATSNDLPDIGAEQTIPPPARSSLPLVLVALLGLGVLGGVGYAVFHKPDAEPQPLGLVPPPPAREEPKPEPEPTPAPPVEKVAEAKPVEVKPSDPVPTPAPVAETKPTPVAKVVAPVAEPVRKGTLVIRATPFAEVFIDGRAPIEVSGEQSFALKAGAHTIRLKHPRKDETVTVTVNAGQTVKQVFEPLKN